MYIVSFRIPTENRWSTQSWVPVSELVYKRCTVQAVREQNPWEQGTPVVCRTQL